MLSRPNADLLAHLQGKGGSLTGTRIYPGPWRYKNSDNVEYAPDSIIKLVAAGLLSAHLIEGATVISFEITEKGREAERSYGRGRAQKRQRGAG